jgi:hypothetical protein
MFPIQTTLKGQLNAVPWSIVEPHEAQALLNHCGQSLQRLAERGGLEAREMVAVLEDKDYRVRWPFSLLTREDRDLQSMAADRRLRELVEERT